MPKPSKRRRSSYSKSAISPSVVWNPKKLIWGWLGLVVVAVSFMQAQGVTSLLNQIAAAGDRFQMGQQSEVETTPQPAAPPQVASPQPPQIQIKPELSQAEILANYQNLIHALVVEQNLKQTAPDNPLRNTAKDQTIATLSHLDGDNRAKLLKFLIDSNLLLPDKPTISLNGADFSGANLDDFQLSQLNLQGAKFSDVRLSRANLSRSKLLGANFDRAELGFANLSQAELFQISAQQANLFFANLHRANLQGSNLAATDLFLANLQEANLNNINLAGADLSFANLNDAELVFANLSDADLSFAKLDNASLSGANLSRSILQGANLTGADLSGANLQSADLSGANLKGANLVGADLTGAILYNTIMPDGTLQN